MSFYGWLHDWQDLIGAIIGALVGGLMGFVGASLVARDARRSERRTAIRGAIADLLGFVSFAEDVERASANQSTSREVLIVSELQRYCYTPSPMFEQHLVGLLGGDDADLAANLMAFNTHYRELRTRLRHYDLSTAMLTGSFDLAFASDQTFSAAKKAVERLAPQYLKFFGEKRKVTQ